MRSYRQALVARINDVYVALHDVYPSSQADWLGERLAESYVAYTRNRELSARQRTAVFNVLLVLLNISLARVLRCFRTVRPSCLKGCSRTLVRSSEKRECERSKRRAS